MATLDITPTRGTTSSPEPKWDNISPVVIVELPSIDLKGGSFGIGRPGVISPAIIDAFSLQSIWRYGFTNRLNSY